MVNEQLIPLGTTDLRVTPLGVGAWEWGDKLTWGFGNGYNENDCRDAFGEATRAGINFIDTAEIYGFGKSESLLGQFVRETNAPVVTATKCFPVPYRWSAKSLHGALRNSLARLGLKQVDLYQMHWAFPPVRIEDWMNAMADAHDAGLVRSIGVSNYSVAQMRRAQDTLAKRGLQLASNQVRYSLLSRAPERDGVLDECRQMQVTLIAYSPLEQGLLTGKYSTAHPPPRRRSFRLGNKLAHLDSLIGVMKEIGQAHGDRTPSQVALNWLMCRNTLPIPGAKNAKQARDNAGALGWRLTEAEVKTLAKASERLE